MVEVEEAGVDQQEEGTLERQEAVEELPLAAQLQRGEDGEILGRQAGVGAGAGEEALEDQNVVEEEAGEYGDTTAFLDPDMPGSRITLPEEMCQDGWHFIDQLSAWECNLCRFTTVQEVPREFQPLFTRACATVLEREAAAESELAKERSLKWFCFLSQALLRTP